jgi:sortase (surface protein transpeptidase)
VRTVVAALGAVLGVGMVLTSVADAPSTGLRARVPTTLTSIPAQSSAFALTPYQHTSVTQHPPSRTLPARPAVPAAVPTFLQIPSLGLAVPVGQMQVIDGVIDPPTADIVYWLTNRGSMPGSNSPGTVFIAGHSWSRGWVPFNLLYDPTDPRRTIRVGAWISLTTQRGHLSYVVQSVQKVPKVTVDEGRVEALMRGVPGRLVLMTCAWYRGTIPSAGENIVVVAQLSAR